MIKLFQNKILFLILAGITGVVFMVKTAMPPNLGGTVETISGEKHSVEVKSVMTADDPIKWIDNYGYIAFKPVGLKWNTGEPVGMDVKTESGTIVKDNFIFKDLYGSGISLEIETDNFRMQKMLRINSLNALGTIPKTATHLEVIYQVDTNFSIKGSDLSEGYQLSDDTRIAPPKVWDIDPTRLEGYVPLPSPAPIPDEARRERETPIEMVYDNKLIGSDLIIKRIPVDYLKTANYPIKTDSTLVAGTGYIADTSIDADGNVSVVVIDSTHFMVCYNVQDVVYGRNGECRAATVAGTEITWGDPVTWDTVADVDDYLGQHAFKIDDTVDGIKFGLVYTTVGSGNWTVAILGSVSGDTVNGFGEKYAVDHSCGWCAGIGDAVDTDTIVVSWTNSDLGGNTDVSARACDISGYGISSCGASVSMNNVAADTYTWNRGLARFDEKEFISFWKHNNNGEEYLTWFTVDGTTIGNISSMQWSENWGSNYVFQRGYQGVDNKIFMNSDVDGSFVIASSSGSISVGDRLYIRGAFGIECRILPDHSDHVVCGYDNGDQYADLWIVDWDGLTATRHTISDVIDTERSDQQTGQDIGVLDSDTYVYCYARNDSSEDISCNIIEFNPVVISTTRVDISNDGNFYDFYGSLDDFGIDQTTASAGFEYGGLGTYASTSEWQQMVATGSYNILVSDVAPFEMTHFRARASNSQGIAPGSDIEFYSAYVSSFSYTQVDFDLGTYSSAEGSALYDAVVMTTDAENEIEGAVANDGFEGVADGSTDLSSSNWRQATISSDDGDLQGETAGTGSGGTGATDDYEGNVFIYTEASSGQSCDGYTNDVCIIELDVPDSDPGEISFWYNTYGCTGGLDLDGYDGADWTQIWTFDANLSDPDTWYNGTASWSTPYEDIRFRIYGGIDYRNDIGLDYIWVSTSSSPWHETGYWFSPPMALSSISWASGSQLDWAEVTDASSSISGWSAISTSSVSAPASASFAEVTNGGSLAGFNIGDDLDGKFLWVRMKLQMTDTDWDSISPRVSSVAYGINDGSDRRIIFTFLERIIDFIKSIFT